MHLLVIPSPSSTGDRAVELAQHLAGAVDGGYAGAQEFGVAGVAPDAGGLQRLFVYAVFGGDLGKAFAGLEEALDETGFAQADAEAFQGFAAWKYRSSVSTRTPSLSQRMAFSMALYIPSAAWFKVPPSLSPGSLPICEPVRCRLSDGPIAPYTVLVLPCSGDNA